MARSGARIRSLGITLTALLGFASAATGEEEGATAEPRANAILEALAYCRWTEASALCGHWRAELERADVPTDVVDALAVRAQHEQKDARLDSVYLTAFVTGESPTSWDWTVRFATRPGTTQELRINVYVITEASGLFAISRTLTDAPRGEHGLDFGVAKPDVRGAKRAGEGKPVAACVELVYAGHAVDVMTDGAAPSADWWKGTVKQGLLYKGEDGDLNPETKSVRILATTSSSWTLDSVTKTRVLRMQLGAVPPKEAADPLPVNEAAATRLPAPHAGYVSKAGRAVTPLSSKRPEPTPKPPADEPAIVGRLAELRLEAVYGPDIAAAEHLGRFLALPTVSGRADVLEAARELATRVESNRKQKLRTALRLKKLDVHDLGPGTGGYWTAVAYFQGARPLGAPARLNVYTLMKSGDVYGTYVTIGHLEGANLSDTYAYVWQIKDSDIPAGDRIVKWRAEIGWKGVCCDVAESPGAAPDGWWLARVRKPHLTKDGRGFASSPFSVDDMRMIEETDPLERLQVAEGKPGR